MKIINLFKHIFRKEKEFNPAEFTEEDRMFCERLKLRPEKFLEFRVQCHQNKLKNNNRAVVLKEALGREDWDKWILDSYTGKKKVNEKTGNVYYQ